MSTYTDYTAASGDYDRTRYPAGSELVVAALATLDRPLADIRLLDAGCGSGNYASALMRHVGHIDAIDVNPGMLAVAKTKLAGAVDREAIAFHQGTVLALPFGDASFDAVMVNQVLHHLEPGTDERYDGHAQALTEIHRVLRPGGIVAVNFCSHRQILRGFWFYGLIPDARADIVRRCISWPILDSTLKTIGYGSVSRIVALDAVLQGAAYFDGLGPLDAAWRAGDSIWAAASDGEVRSAEAEIRQRDKAGSLAQFVRDEDAQRPDIGQFTLAIARKG
jgi:SAM-dependent methyltransferase